MMTKMGGPRISRTTFVLGAGFSKAAGFPLVRDLRSGVLDFVARNPDPSWSADLTPGAKGFPLGQFYEGLQAADPSGTLGFEELLIKLNEFNGQSFHPALRSRTILEAGCARLFWQIQKLLVTVPPCYRNFAEWLFSSGGMPKHSVVSFNWDLVVERALEEQSFNWFYSRITDNSVAVLKPHGSINLSHHRGQGAAGSDEWAQAVLGGTVDCLRNEIFRDPFEGGINEQFRFMILPGTPTGGSLSEAAEPIWSMARQVLEKSETIVFIGYSLPVYDAGAATRLKDCCSGKRIEVYNPNATDLLRFKDLLDSNVLLEEKKFEDCLYGSPPPWV